MMNEMDMNAILLAFSSVIDDYSDIYELAPDDNVKLKLEVLVSVYEYIKRQGRFQKYLAENIGKENYERIISSYAGIERKEQFRVIKGGKNE